jgi:type II secretory pathway component PulF
MSAGNLSGAVMNTFAFAMFWVVGGFVVDKLGNAFNVTIRTLPTFQDAVTGFQTTQIIYGFLLVIMFFAVWFNYFINESNLTSGEI